MLETDILNLFLEVLLAVMFSVFVLKFKMDVIVDLNSVL